MSFENSEKVLVLNRHWMPVGTKKIKDAFISLCSEGQPAFLALDIEYETDDAGNPNFNKIIKMTPESFENWITLPIRAWDLWITTPKLQIRVPTVIVSTQYDKMPIKRLAPTNKRIWERDEGICQISGKKLTKSTGSIDHLIPKSRFKKMGLKGSADTWKNKVLMHKDINFKKGDKTLAEAGLKLIRMPSEPHPVPICSLITEAKHADWNHFLIKNAHEFAQR